MSPNSTKPKIITGSIDLNDVLNGAFDFLGQREQRKTEEANRTQNRTTTEVVAQVQPMSAGISKEILYIGGGVLLLVAVITLVKN